MNHFYNSSKRTRFKGCIPKKLAWRKSSFASPEKPCTNEAVDSTNGLAFQNIASQSFDCCISDYYDVISALRCATLSGNWPVHRPIWSVTMSAIEPNLLLMNDYDIDGRGCHLISLIAPLIQSALKHVQYA